MLKYFLIFIICCSSNELLGQKIIHTEWEGKKFKKWEMKKLKITGKGTKLVPIKCEIFEGNDFDIYTHTRTIEYLVNNGNGVSFPNKLSLIGDDDGKVFRSYKTMLGEDCTKLIETISLDDKNKWTTEIDTLKWSYESDDVYENGLDWDMCY